MSKSVVTSDKVRPAGAVYEFNPKRDIAPVDAPMVLTFEEMLVSGVVPSDIEELEFSDAGDDANVIAGRVTNVFQAMRVKNYILSNPQRPTMNVSQSVNSSSSTSFGEGASSASSGGASSSTSTTVE